MSAFRAFRIKPVTLVLTTLIMSCTSILVAAPVEYIPAPGGLFVIAPAATEGVNDALNNTGNNTNPSQLDESNPKEKAADGSSVIDMDGRQHSDRSSVGSEVGLSKTLNTPSAQQHTTKVATTRAAPLIDNYANATYDGRNAPVGHVAANFAVNANGAATYSIQIAIPPGIAGIQPKVSLNYNSQSGNGIAGRGFDLSGISHITRCGSSLAQDKKVLPVDLTDNDNYCLDGQRLKEVSRSGNIRTYQTEVNSFSDIKAEFDNSLQPIKFIVKTVAGDTLTYGGTADSQLQPLIANSTVASTRILTWSISQSMNIKGNYINYFYQKDSSIAGAEQLITRIEYTGTSSQLPFAAIYFDYDLRLGLKSTSYIAGGALYQGKRLQKIRVTQGTAGSVATNLVREYRLNYYTVDSTSAQNYDRLKSIEECNNYSETDAAIACLPPTWFRWDGGYQSQLTNVFGKASIAKTLSEEVNRATYTPPDTALMGEDLGFLGFNGQEPVLSEYGNLSPQLWDRGSYDESKYNELKQAGKDYNLFGDVNGDGLTDIVGLKSYNVRPNVLPSLSFTVDYKAVVAISNGKTFQKGIFHNDSLPLITNSTFANIIDNPAYLSDVNADGLSDLVIFGYEDVKVFLSNGTRFESPKSWNKSFLGKGGWASGDFEKGVEQRFVVDMNGDGRADLVGLDEGGIFAAFSEPNNPNIFGDVVLISTDFNVGNSNRQQFKKRSGFFGDVGYIW